MEAYLGDRMRVIDIRPYDVVSLSDFDSQMGCNQGTLAERESSVQLISSLR
jgi:hypothetical protein